MKKSQWWRIAAVTATALVVAAVGFLYWLSKQNIGGEHSAAGEKDSEGEPPDAEAFPEFASSSPLMLRRGSNGIAVSLRDAENQPLRAAPYCLKFVSGCWTCGIADQEAKTHEVFLEVDEPYAATTYEEAFASWQDIRTSHAECGRSDAGLGR